MRESLAVLAGLLELDPASFYSVGRSWVPTIVGSDLQLSDLIAFATA